MLSTTGWALKTWFKITLALAVAVFFVWLCLSTACFCLAVIAAVLIDLWVIKSLYREWVFEASFRWWWHS
jgi:hypothetical protein